VRYEIGLFRGEAAQAAAQGHFVHVYVDRATRRPVALPDALKRALAPLVPAATCEAYVRRLPAPLHRLGDTCVRAAVSLGRAT
jgi:hypothetical protein